MSRRNRRPRVQVADPAGRGKHKVANPDRAHAEAARRRSGASGFHGDKRSRRARSRAASKRRAIADF